MNPQNDDFIVRPMTEGLGFNKNNFTKKPHTLSEITEKADLTSRAKKTTLPSAPSDLDEALKPRSTEDILNEIKMALRPQESRPRLSDTLPRNAQDVIPDFIIEKTPQRMPTEIIDFQIPKAALVEADGAAQALKRGAHDAKVRELVPVGFSLAATVLDAFFVTALFILFLLSFISATQLTLTDVFLKAQESQWALLSLGVLFVAVWQMYAVVSRSFFGATLGEWTFDLQVGEDDQQSQSHYSTRLIGRSLVLIFTGLFVLPALSLLINKDIVGRWAGLQLFRRNFS